MDAIGKITYVNTLVGLLVVPILLASEIAAFLNQQYLNNTFVNWRGYKHTNADSENQKGDNFFWTKIAFRESN